MTDKRRVVVTGIGLRTPIGHSLAELREAFMEGRTGVRAMPEWREIENLRTGMNNNFAFGGINTSLLFSLV